MKKAQKAYKALFEDELAPCFGEGSKLPTRFYEVVQTPRGTVSRTTGLLRLSSSRNHRRGGFSFEDSVIDVLSSGASSDELFVTKSPTRKASAGVLYLVRHRAIHPNP